jgi:6-phosphogluconolactonase
MKVRVFRDASHLADSAAEEIAAWLRVDGDSPTIGLAGGTTPQATYERLRRLQLPWDKTHMWLTDERFVPPDHDDSNTRMTRDAFAGHVPARFHGVPHLPDDPAASAAAYERELLRVLPFASGGLQPGLVLLGMGTDGHTASLFPGSAALDERRRGYTAVPVPSIGWRLTATLPLLAAARRIMFIVTGAAKAATVAEVLGGDSDLPAARVGDGARDVVWLLDREAASRLPFD